MSTFKIPDLISEVKAELEPIIPAIEAQGDARVPKDLKPIVTDRQKVKQILLNLLSNALKFTHQGGVTISAKRDLHEATRSLSRADTGIGIAGRSGRESSRTSGSSTTRRRAPTAAPASACRFAAGSRRCSTAGSRVRVSRARAPRSR